MAAPLERLGAAELVVVVAAVAEVAAVRRLGLWLAAVVACPMRDGDGVLEEPATGLTMEAPVEAELAVALGVLRVVGAAGFARVVAVEPVVEVLTGAVAAVLRVPLLAEGAAATVGLGVAAGAGDAAATGAAVAVEGAAAGRATGLGAGWVAAGWVAVGWGVAAGCVAFGAAATGAGAAWAAGTGAAAAGRRLGCAAGGVPRSFRRVPTSRRSGSSSWFRATRRSTLVP